MNTIKFNRMPGISTERHNPEEEKSRQIFLFSEETMISDPLNLNLLISYGCNCDCNFCIMKYGKQLPVIQDDEYLHKLDKVFNQLKGLPIEITITGGEPTLFPKRLIPVLHMIDSIRFSHRTFLTNGSGLLKYWEGKPIIQYLKDAGAIYNINLSRHHMDETRNRKLMKGIVPTNSDLKQISSFCDVNQMDIRLSCNMMKSGICDFDSMMEYMDFAEDMGFHNMIFRESPIHGLETIKISPIMEQIKKDNSFQYIETIENSHYTIDILKYNSYVVKLYQSKKNEHLLSNLVYREGLLSDSWDIDHFYEVRG